MFNRLMMITRWNITKAINYISLFLCCVAYSCNVVFAIPTPPNQSSENGKPNSFIVNFHCQLNEELCRLAQQGLEKAVHEISRNVQLVRPIIVDGTFESFCHSEESKLSFAEVESIEARNLGKTGISLPATCGTSDGLLGNAAPSAFMSFSQSWADAEYVYPSALAKQLNATWASVQPDISARFNADVRWWFGSGRIKKNQYDFTQVLVHELLHGMGFISSWFAWISQDSLLPAPVKTDLNGMVSGLSLPYIFNKYMWDNIHDVPMHRHAMTLQSALETIPANEYQKWTSAYTSSSASLIAKDLMRVVTSDRGLVFKTKHNVDVLLNTPSTYSKGSSISHLDLASAEGTEDWLMRPKALMGVAMHELPHLQDGFGILGPRNLAILSTLGYTTSLSI